MPLNRVLRRFLPGRKLEEIHDLEGWRIYYIRLMLLICLFALPLGLFFSLSTYLSEQLYGMIYFQLSLIALTAAILWLGDRIPQVHVFFALIYGITLTILTVLGPYYARPAWLIICVLTAAFLFGRSAAALIALLNTAALMALYVLAPAHFPAWALVHQEPLGRWLMFCGNLMLLSLISTLPATLLINRMNSLLTKEQNFSRKLTTESEDLQAANARLEKEIEERVKAEAENRRLQSELVQVQKMDAMGTMAGGIAHDFNNILSAIIGYGQLVQADPAQSERSRQNIEKLLKAGDRAKALVQQILTFSRKVETSVEPLDLTEGISDALRMIRALIPANVRLLKNIAGACTVTSSSTFIHQILMNLCSNAIHAMGADGGVLEVEMTGVTLTAADASAVPLAPGDYARISVRDTGCGIPPEVIGRIFEPYFTTKSMGSGTGLGLSVVHGIVRSHGGAIICRSTPGQGTAFDVYLPRIENVVALEPAANGNIPTGTETVLYVDDEAMLADTSGQILKTLGYRVVTTTSSIEALEMFKDDPARFDLVITDMAMPLLTGDKLAQKILEIRPGVPIIICTGYSEYITNQGAARMGIRDFLMKPFTMDQLAFTLRHALDAETSPEKYRALFRLSRGGRNA